MAVMTTPTAGQIPIGQTGGSMTSTTMTGDVTITSGGVTTVAATAASSPNTIVKRDGGSHIAANFVGPLTGNADTATLATTASSATSVSGAFGGSGGDVSGTQSNLTVNSIGGQSATAVGSATTLANQLALFSTANFYLGPLGSPSGNGGAGNDNVAFGINTFPGITSGNFNTGVGDGCGILLGNGSSNVCVGFFAMTSCGGGANDNVAVGSHALWRQAGNNTVGIGSLAGSTYTSYTNCVFLGLSADATTNGLTNSGAIGWTAQISISNAYNIGNGVNLGVNQPTPLNSLHVSQGSTANINAIQVDYSTNPAATPTLGFSVYGDSSHQVFVKTADGVATQINAGAGAVSIGTPQTALITGITSTALNGGPQTILAANATRNLQIMDVEISVSTAVTGANLLAGYGPSTLLTYTPTTLLVNTVSRNTQATTGSGWNTTVNNQTITLAPSGTLLTGLVDVRVTYVFTT